MQERTYATPWGEIHYWSNKEAVKAGSQLVLLPGLGLTKVNLLPHYQQVRDDVLDGLRLFKDITYPDSMGRTFCAIPDGSYLFIEGGRTELRGEAYRIRDGRINQISQNGQRVLLNQNGGKG